MNLKNDIRAGYRVPDGYFEDFSARMAQMAAQQRPVRRFNWRPLVMTASAAAAVVILAFGLFNLFPKSADDLIAEASSEVIVTRYFGATETEVVDYYLTEESESDEYSDEDVLDYLSNSGTVNLYALMEY